METQVTESPKKKNPCSASSVAGVPWPLLKGNLPIWVELRACFPLQTVWKDTQGIQNEDGAEHTLTTPNSGVINPLVCSDIGLAAPNPCVRHCSGKCETVSFALFKLREIKATLLKEAVSTHTWALPKLRCPSPLR